jgi:hypothetical protein
MNATDQLLPSDYARLVDAVRLDLQEAGNPAFVVAVRDAQGEVDLAPMVFAAVGPAGEYARRLASGGPGEETVVIISRQAVRRRQSFDIIEPATLRRLHLQQEVIEETFLETDGPI